MSVFTIFTVLGGIALFLFGMQMMSDGLEKAAGSKMRQILEVFTKNRVIGVLVGFVITGVIQSSSATTATVVSFVNAGLMTLTQSVGVTLGANIGTTVTGQLMAFKFEEFAPIIVAASLVCYMFVKNHTVKKIGYIVLGFGILFLGMGMMKDAMSSMADSPEIVDALSSISSPILLVLIGLVVTAVIQSSSAMVGILIGMAASGLMSVEACFFVILGSNIGACVTALIASINCNREAKRAALIHLLFNVIGTIVIYILLLLFADPITDFIYMLSPGTDSADVAARAVAMANTVFRTFGVIIMLPFTNGLVKLTRIILPVKDYENAETEEGMFKYIGNVKAISSVTAALAATEKEINRLAGITFTNLERAMDALINKNSANIDRVDKTEDNIDKLCKEMQDYLVQVTQLEVPVPDEYKIAGYFHTIIDIERIGDHASNIAELAQKRIDDKFDFSPKAYNEINKMYGEVRTNLDSAMDIFMNGKFELLPEIIEREDNIDKMEKAFQAEHIERMTKGECTPKAGIFSDVLSNLERIGDHADNIAIALIPDNKLVEITGKSRIEL